MCSGVVSMDNEMIVSLLVVTVISFAILFVWGPV